MANNENLEQAAQAAEKEGKANKEKKTEKKPSIFQRASKWLRELKIELKKVQWPTKKQTFNNTLIVIACVTVVGAFIWIFDFIASGAIQGIISLLG